MIELFYFSSLGLMVKVEYANDGNSLRYASHRTMGDEEKVMAEQYILVKIAAKAGSHINRPAELAYAGTDERLKQRLDRFHEQNELALLSAREIEINAAVNSLINASMRNYYTEKISELIMSARNELKEVRRPESLGALLKQQMNNLLNAYNCYADQKVTLDEVIPLELKPYWPGLEEARRYVTHSHS